MNSFLGDALADYFRDSSYKLTGHFCDIRAIIQSFPIKSCHRMPQIVDIMLPFIINKNGLSAAPNIDFHISSCCDRFMFGL
jgi:hypothetical protein